MHSIILCLIAISNAYVIFDGLDFFDSWAILNTAGTNIQLAKNSTTNYLSANLRCWDTIRVQRVAHIETSSSNFFSFEVYYKSNSIRTMRFRTRLFSSAYNQQTETELKPYDYIVKSGIATKVFIPLSYQDEKNKLQTFSIQRIEVTDEPIDFSITKITLEAEGVPTPNNEVFSDADQSSEDKGSETDGVVELFVSIIFALLVLI